MLSPKNTDQMELDFQTPSTSRRTHRPKESRSQWWFNQMRRVVDMAIEWQPAPPARPEQSYLPQ